MKLLIVKFFMIFLISGTVQNPEEDMIRNFISSCKDNTADITSIRAKYICYKSDNLTQKAALDKFIEENLSNLRKELQGKDLSKLKIVKATDSKDVQKKFLETDFSKIFILKENKKILLYFLIENDKISAFNVLDKGGIKTFITLCN